MSTAIKRRKSSADNSHGGFIGNLAFSKIAIIILNQVIRPFTAKWHQKNQNGAFESAEECEKFRSDLSKLQVQLRNYTGLLADLADVEDLTEVKI